MIRFPKDIIEKIASYMSIKDFIIFCKDNPQCDDFWLRRFQKDFPMIAKNVDLMKNPKQKYLKVNELISQTIENIIEEIIKQHGYGGKFLRNTKFESKLHSILWNSYLKLINFIDPFIYDHIYGFGDFIDYWVDENLEIQDRIEKFIPSSCYACGDHAYPEGRYWGDYIDDQSEKLYINLIQIKN